MVDFKWIKPGQGQVVVAPASANAPPIVGVVVPPAVDTAQRGIHSTWQGGAASLIVTELLPLVGLHLSPGVQVALIAVLTGALAVVRSWLVHRKVAKA